MYTATAIFKDLLGRHSEIGFGEGEGDAYAVEECIESISQIYKDCASKDDIQIIVRNDSDVVYATTWLDYEVATN